MNQVLRSLPYYGNRAYNWVATHRYLSWMIGWGLLAVVMLFSGSLWVILPITAMVVASIFRFNKEKEAVAFLKWTGKVTRGVISWISKEILLPTFKFLGKQFAQAAGGKHGGWVSAYTLTSAAWVLGIILMFAKWTSGLGFTFASYGLAGLLLTVFFHIVKVCRGETLTKAERKDRAKQKRDLEHQEALAKIKKDLEKFRREAEETRDEVNLKRAKQRAKELDDVRRTLENAMAAGASQEVVDGILRKAFNLGGNTKSRK